MLGRVCKRQAAFRKANTAGGGTYRILSNTGTQKCCLSDSLCGLLEMTPESVTSQQHSNTGVMQLCVYALAYNYVYVWTHVYVCT